MNTKIRILVAEDHLIARVGVSAIINCQPDMVVVAEAVNGRQAVQKFRKYLPNLALLDMRMPNMSGLEAAIKIRAEFPDARLIALTDYGGDEDVRRTLAAGVGESSIEGHGSCHPSRLAGGSPQDTAGKR